MASLLYVSVRPERGAADAEYLSFRRALGVDELDRTDLLAEPLTTGVLERYRGVVVGGSPFNVTDAEKSDEQQRVERDLERLASRAASTDIAAFFTCYGIGVVTRMLGGTVGLGAPEPASSVVVTTTPAAKSDPVFGPAGEDLVVFTAHKEGATDVPPGAELLARGETCPVQAYRVGTHLYATQFHPEPTPRDFADRMVFYRTKGYFDAAQFDAVQAQVLASRVTDATALLRRFGTDVVIPA